MPSHDPQLTRLQTGVLFAAALLGVTLMAMPALGLRHPKGDISVNEHRQLKQFPRFANREDWQAFPQAFEAYFADRFKYRESLTNAHHRLMVKWFQRSPTQKVVIGDNGWLFFNGESSENNAIEVYHRNAKPLTAQEVSDIHDELSRRRDWIASWGGRTLFVLVPNKEAIYPEHLPPSLQRSVGPVSRFEQWAGIFAGDSSLAHVDLRPALRAAKTRGLIYYRSDSHWNLDGAYIGYRETIDAVRRWFPDVTPIEKPVATEPGGYRGDLAQMLSAGDVFDEPDQAPYPAPRTQCAKLVATTPGGLSIPKRSEPFVFECANPKLPTAVIVRDSMAKAWAPLLPNNFRRTIAMFNWFPDAEAIEREKPDLVIFEAVERSMDQFLAVRLGTDPATGRPRFN